VLPESTPMIRLLQPSAPVARVGDPEFGLRLTDALTRPRGLA
jgi:hypothetical protein